MLDESLQSYVGKFSLKSGHSYSIKVPIAKDYVEEIKNIWNESIKDSSNELLYMGWTLYARAERHPMVVKRYGTLGKITDWAKTTLSSTLDPRTFWYPDLEIMVNTSAGEVGMGVKPSATLCHVEEDLENKLNEAGLKASGLTKEAATSAVKIFRQRRQ